MDKEREEALLKRIQAHPENILDRFALSKLYCDAQVWDKAVDACQAILERQANYMVVQMQLGNALVHLGKVEQAVDIYEQALASAKAQNHQGPQEEIEDILAELKP